jgi:hypothetical protein
VNSFKLQWSQRWISEGIRDCGSGMALAILLNFIFIFRGAIFVRPQELWYPKWGLYDAIPRCSLTERAHMLLLSPLTSVTSTQLRRLFWTVGLSKWIVTAEWLPSLPLRVLQIPGSNSAPRPAIMLSLVLHDFLPFHRREYYTSEACPLQFIIHTHGL